MNMAIKSSDRTYLSLQPLTLLEVPAHRDFNSDAGQHIGLKEFLFKAFKEADAVDFDSEWTSKEKVVDRRKPERRSKSINNKLWLARRSFVDRRIIKAAELDALLAQDHCRKEAAYSKDVYDANELIRWNPEDLDLDRPAMRSLRISAIQMSIYEMFHHLPYPLMQDRVFFVLVLTVHSGYVPPGSIDDTLKPQSHTLQLPINIKSFKKINDNVTQRSHVHPRTHRYSPGAISWGVDTPLELKNSLARQQDYTGHRLTEGRYVSLERVRPALFGDPSPPEMGKSVTSHVIPWDTDRNHVWDMATRSSAGGVVRISPSFLTRPQIFAAIVKDVEEVLDLHRRNNTVTEPNRVAHKV